MIIFQWAKRRTTLLNWIAAIAMLIAIGLIFYYAPVERTMGNVQRIFYFHVGAGWVAAVTFFTALIGGVVYLWRRQPIWDTLALASVEIGLVFMMINIVSGSIWGKPAWNTWWIWSPRLTSITIMWLVYIAYLVLRSAISDSEKQRRFSSVYVIAAFATVIVTYGSIRILRDIHPVMFGGAMESAQGMEQGLQEFEPGLQSMQMGITLTVTTLSFSLLYIAWLANRMRLQEAKDRLLGLKLQVLSRFS